MRSIFHLQDLRGEADDLHEVLLAQLAGDGTEDAGAARVARAVDQHGRVLVERDRGAVVAPERLASAHDDRLDDLALLDGALRCRRLDRGGDHVPHARVATMRAALHADAQDLAGAGVVGDTQPGFLLDHRPPSSQIVLCGREKQGWQGRTRIRVLGSREATGATEGAASRSFAARRRVRDVGWEAVTYLASSRTSARRQFFDFEMGRVSTIRTRSPTFAAFCSSWAWNFVERRTTFL